MRGFFGSTAALLSTLGLSSAAWAQQQTGPYYGPHMWDGGGWMFFGPLMMIVFIAAIVGNWTFAVTSRASLLGLKHPLTESSNVRLDRRSRSQILTS